MKLGKIAVAAMLLLVSASGANAGALEGAQPALDMLQEDMPTTTICPGHGNIGADDPVYIAMCQLLEASSPALTQGGRITAAFHDHDGDDETDPVVVDADGDGRIDIVEYTIVEPSDFIGDVVSTYIQLDYFFTDNRTDTPDETYDLRDFPPAPGEGFDVPIHNVFLYSSATGSIVTTSEEGSNLFRLTNDFRDADGVPDRDPDSDIDLALYQNASHPDIGPGGESFVTGRCIVCIDIEANRATLDEHPGDLEEAATYVDEPASAVNHNRLRGRGIIDFDATPGIVDATDVDSDGDTTEIICLAGNACTEDSIDESHDADGDGFHEKTPTWLYLSFGWNAHQEQLDDLREDTRGYFFDREGIDAGALHIKFPQDIDEDRPDPSLFATKYSNYDNDDDADGIELTCNSGDVSNPFYGRADCADLDGDGVKNAVEVGEERNPLSIRVVSGSPAEGAAPLTTRLQYSCPTDATDYRVILGDIAHDGAIDSSDRLVFADLRCGLGAVDVVFDPDAAEPRDVGPYLNGATAPRDVAPRIYRTGAPTVQDTTTIQLDGSLAPDAYLSITQDAVSASVTPVITYRCSVGSGGEIAQALLDLGKVDPVTNVVLDVTSDCDGTNHTISDQAFEHANSKRDQNHVAHVELRVFSAQHPALSSVATDFVTVGSAPAPLLDFTVVDEDIFADHAPDGTISYSCSPGSAGDTITSATIDLGYVALDGGVETVHLDCQNPAPITFPKPFFNDDDIDRAITLTMQVETALAGGPYTVTDSQSIVVLANDVEPGAFEIECVSADCPSDGSTVIASDQHLDEDNTYDITYRYVPSASLQDQDITAVDFVLKKGSSTVKTLTASLIDGVWNTTDTLDPGTTALTYTVTATVSDSGKYTARAPGSLSINLPAEGRSNAAPVLSQASASEDPFSAEGTSVPVAVEVNALDLGPAGRTKDEGEPVTVQVRAKAADEADYSDPVTLSQVALCDPEPLFTDPLFGIGIPDPTACSAADHNDGKLENGEQFSGMLQLRGGVEYELEFNASDAETSSISVLPFANDGEISTAAEGLAGVQNAIDETIALVEGILEDVEQLPEQACGDGNGDDPEACLAHNIAEICDDPEASSDPTRCRSDLIENAVNQVVGIVEPVACQYDGALTDDCADRYLENVTAIVQGVVGDACAFERGITNATPACGGNPGNVVDDIIGVSVPNPVHLLTGRCELDDATADVNPECEKFGVDNPLAGIDQTDTYDSDGDGIIDEPNGQIDVIENQVIFLNPDEFSHDDPNDPFDGTSGATLTVFHVNGFGTPVPRYIMRVGDVSGTNETERLVLQEYDAFGAPISVQCLLSDRQGEGDGSALFYHEGTGHFRGETYCGKPQYSNNVRVAQASIFNEGYQSMAVWLDDDNNGVRDDASINNDAREKSNEDVLGFYFAPASEGSGLELSLTAGHGYYRIKVLAEANGNFTYEDDYALYEDGASLSDDGETAEDVGVHTRVYWDHTNEYNSTVNGNQLYSYTPADNGNTLVTSTPDENRDGIPDSVIVTEPFILGDLYEQDLSGTPNATAALKQITSLFQTIGGQQPSINAGFGPIDDNEDGVPEGVWMDGDGDDARAEDGSEDRYFADMTDPDALVLLAEELAAQAEDAVDEQTATVLGIVLPNCGTEGTPGQPCAHDEDRGIMAALGGPLPGMRFEIPGFGYIYL